MKITLTAKLVNNRVNESSAFTLSAAFFDDGADTWTASAPTTTRYRIDRVNSSPACSSEVLGWTTLTPATTNSIAITSSQNAILNTYGDEERRQITVEANAGLATQYSETYRYSVVNLAGQT